MTNEICSIAIDKMIPHPDNPNRISKVNFAKLVRNIERTGRYEPLVVRPCPDKKDHFQIINGHHRCQALIKLGYKQAEAVVWDIDDHQTDILLTTLNRLGGSDTLEKKLVLLTRLNEDMKSRELAKLLPMNSKQIERLVNLKMPSMPTVKSSFANPLVFFVDDEQRKIIQEALSLAGQKQEIKISAARNAAALTAIAEKYLVERKEKNLPAA
jgi:ParB/RepB/Spo0J family partition protein